MSQLINDVEPKSPSKKSSDLDKNKETSSADVVLSHLK
jgi:hypothetical protein